MFSVLVFEAGRGFNSADEAGDEEVTMAEWTVEEAVRLCGEFAGDDWATRMTGEGRTLSDSVLLVNSNFAMAELHESEGGFIYIIRS